MHESDQTWIATKYGSHLEMFMDHVNVCVSQVNIKYVFVLAGCVLPVYFLEDDIITLVP